MSGRRGPNRPSNPWIRVPADFGLYERWTNRFERIWNHPLTYLALVIAMNAFVLYLSTIL